MIVTEPLAPDLHEQLLAMANTRGTNGYLFGGSVTETAPFDANAQFQGDALARKIPAGPTTDATINASGAMAFTTAGGRDPFADLTALETALRNGDTAAMGQSVSDLDTSRRQIVAAQADAGLSLARLTAADAAQDAAQTALTGQRSREADADVASTYSQLAAVQRSMQQSAQVARSVLDTLSNLNFG